MEIYIFLFLLIFIINLIPAFMPPTWIILSFFYLQFHLGFMLTVILGVIAATLGRVVLALIARRYLEKILPARFLTNYQDLGEYLSKNQKLTIPVVFGYAFSPISSNALFIIAGLSNLNLTPIALSFFIGRLISYTFWITASDRLSSRLEEIFASHFSNLGTLISAVVSGIIILAVGQIKWKKLLGI